MSISKENIESQGEIVVVNEEISQKCSCSETFLDKKLITACLASALLAGVAVFSAMKVGMLSTEKEVQRLVKDYDNLDGRVKNVSKVVSNLNNSMNSVLSDIQSNQENLAYIYTKIASLQKDMSAIKDELHIEIKAVTDTELQNMSADQISFIESLESLINEGAPFDEFFKSYEGKFDVSTYAAGKALLEFKSAKTLSISELQKLFANVGQSEFGITLNETFWEKQKRIIKEKFISALTIKKESEENKDGEKEEKLDDKTLFAKASNYMNDGKIEEAVSLLEDIEKSHNDVIKFVSQAKQRINLIKAFDKFKKEFISVASTNTNSTDTSN